MVTEPEWWKSGDRVVARVVAEWWQSGGRVVAEWWQSGGRVVAETEWWQRQSGGRARVVAEWWQSGGRGQWGQGALDRIMNVKRRLFSRSKMRIQLFTVLPVSAMPFCNTTQGLFGA